MTQTAALILMGGQNKRMNGQHKAFLKFHEKSFLEQIISELNPICHPIYLSVDAPSKYSTLSYPMIKDTYKAIGPMGGIYSSLHQVETHTLFITACDMPFITTDFARYMISLHQPGYDCTVLTDEEGFFYPLGGVYQKSILPLVKEMIEAKQYRMQALIKKASSQIIPLSQTPFSKQILQNINTPENYQALIHLTL